MSSLAELVNRITDYMANGGAWNPEEMEHDKVRDLLMDCRAALTQQTERETALESEIVNLKAQVKALQSELFGSHNVSCNVRSHAVGAGQGCNCATPMPKTELQELYRQAKALRDALDYMYRYFVMPGHARLAKNCPNKNCPFCKAIAALDTGESRKEGEK